MAESGTILGGRYRVIAAIGQGGMATIYRAVDTQLGREVAIKLLRPEYLQRPRLRLALPPGGPERRVAEPSQRRDRVRLRRGSVRAVHRHGVRRRRGPGDDPAPQRRAPGDPDGAHRVGRGPGPGRRPRARHRPSRREAGQRAHRPRRAGQGRRLRHRPGHRRGPDDPARARPSGSVHYFSPEQARGEPATASSDIYALGIVLYEMLTGSRPWEGDSAASVALARLSGPIPDPATVRPSTPADLALVVRTALAREPDDRYASRRRPGRRPRRDPAARFTGRAAAGVAALGAAAAPPATPAAAAAAAGVANANPTVVVPARRLRRRGRRAAARRQGDRRRRRRRHEPDGLGRRPRRRPAPGGASPSSSSSCCPARGRTSRPT